MPANEDPEAARFDYVRIVHLKRFHRRSANRIHTLDMGAILAPSKVIVPALATGIEEGNILACLSILCLGAIAFESIAAMAGKPKIFKSGFAALRYAENVFDFKRAPHNQRRRTAVTAAVACLLFNLTTQMDGDVGRHQMSAVGEGSAYPRHLRSRQA